MVHPQIVILNALLVNLTVVAHKHPALVVVMVFAIFVVELEVQIVYHAQQIIIL
jgi:hypothetical protein